MGKVIHWADVPVKADTPLTRMASLNKRGMQRWVPSTVLTSMKIPQTHSELLSALRTQIAFLRRSSAAFDAGQQDEAIRLATHVRILVHQTTSSHALLAQLGLLESLAFVDTAIDSSVKREIGPQGRILLRQTMSPGVLAGIGLAADGFRFSPLLGGEDSPRVHLLIGGSPTWYPQRLTKAVYRADG